MLNLQKHFSSITNCWIYVSPSSGARPRKIPPGVEAAELLTGGKVWFSPDSSPEKCYGRGSIFWHRSGEQTVCHSDPADPYRCLAIYFRVRENETCPSPRIGRWNSAASMELFVADILNLFRRNGTENSGFLAVYAAVTLLRQMKFPPEPDLPSALQLACRIIDADPGADPGPEQLAAACGVSKSYLFHLFRVFLNSSPHRYRIERRLEMARHLLIQPGIPIKSIAESCGFHNIEVFYRHFRRAEGTSPGNYRSSNILI